MIKTVIRIKNDMVMVFDEDGEQIPEYQGNYGDVKEKILADAPMGSVFNHWFGHSLGPEMVTGEAWCIVYTLSLLNITGSLKKAC